MCGDPRYRRQRRQRFLIFVPSWAVDWQNKSQAPEICDKYSIRNKHWYGIWPIWRKRRQGGLLEPHWKENYGNELESRQSCRWNTVLLHSLIHISSIIIHTGYRTHQFIYNISGLIRWQYVYGLKVISSWSWYYQTAGNFHSGLRISNYSCNCYWLFHS